MSQRNKNFTIQDIKVEAHTLLIGVSFLCHQLMSSQYVNSKKKILLQASDTTAVSLSTLLLMLAMHQDYQEKVFQELLTIMPNPDVDLTPTNLNKMIHLDQCIRESLRLFPTVPLIGRTAQETINLNGYDIPPNLPIFIGIRQIHRNNEYYADPLSFNPDRFEPNEHHPNKDKQGMYIPFSLGQRNCIGKFYCLRVFFLFFGNLFAFMHLFSF